MRHYPWKKCYSSVKIASDALTSSMIETIKDKIWQSGECLSHEMGYSIMNHPYRKYRRGKNRCKFCGVKK